MILELSATHVRRQCPVCPGTGRRMQERPGGLKDYLPCPTCRGTGEVTVPRSNRTADPGLGVRLVYSDFTGGL